MDPPPNVYIQLLTTSAAINSLILFIGLIFATLLSSLIIAPNYLLDPPATMYWP